MQPKNETRPLFISRVPNDSIDNADEHYNYVFIHDNGVCVWGDTNIARNSNPSFHFANQPPNVENYPNSIYCVRCAKKE